MIDQGLTTVCVTHPSWLQAGATLMMRLPLAAGRGPLADLSQRPAKVSSIPWDDFWGKTHRKSQVEQVIYTYYIYTYMELSMGNS